MQPRYLLQVMIKALSMGVQIFAPLALIGCAVRECAVHACNHVHEQLPAAVACTGGIRLSLRMVSSSKASA
jgi:hypothetical protein